MKLLGQLSELTRIIFRKGAQAVTIEPSTQTGSPTILIPDTGSSASRTVVLTDLAQTLTNKTLSGNTATSLVSGSGTLTLNTSGTVTVPSTTDTLVGKATTDTLTNKTLTSPAITTPTGLVKGDVGLGDVDNTSDSAKNSAAVTLTNKTLDNPIIDNSATLLHETTPATPAAGRVRVYPKADNTLYVLDSSGVETAVGSGSGSGEKNYITNPSAKSVLTGWNQVGDLDVTRTTTAAELPREYTTAAGLKIAADANTQSAADYVYFDFTLDDVDLSRKLKIQWSQKLLGAYAAGQLEVVITTQADRTTALHTPATAAIPAADGIITTSFDSSTTATLSLVIRATTDMAVDTGIVISDVIVGPGQIVQGAAIGPATPYTQVITAVTSDPTLGSIVRNLSTWKRIGDSMEIKWDFEQAAGSGGSGIYLFTIPLGLSVDTTKATLTGGSAADSEIGSGTFNTGADGLVQSTVPCIVVAYDATHFAIVQSAITGDAVARSRTFFGSASTYTGFGNALSFSIRALIPIAEWAGSGTVNLGSNDVEYAYNTSTTVTDDSTSFGYGPDGGSFPSGTAAGLFFKRVRFQSPIQKTDQIFMQISRSPSSNWITVGSFDFDTELNSYTEQNGVRYGAAVTHTTVNSTDINVRFGQYYYASGTYGAAGQNWSGLNSAIKYRIVKAKAGAAVGFGLASATQSGLVTSQESVSQVSLTLSGAIVGTIPANFSRIGKTCTMTINNVSLGAAASTAALAFAGIPSTYQVTRTVGSPIFLNVNGTYQFGTLYMNGASGLIHPTVALGNFTAGQTIGIDVGITMSWVLD